MAPVIGHAQVSHQNVQFDCGGPSPRILDTTYADYFDKEENIFEGVVASTGRIPNTTTQAVNLCWVTFKVDTWYSTSITDKFVNALFYTDPTGDMGTKKDEPVHCPVKVGDSLLVFGGKYKPDNGRKESNFYIDKRMTFVIPSEHASFLRNLLGIWKGKKLGYSLPTSDVDGPIP